ncbi:response regulator [Gelidibacter salicanalis]|uniref:Response regulator n=1 Tax=Gelidibacter salicanalis TaxID=291193 RepID=A0A934NKQ5_9FLAO|nr:response regulator [Gelidibacter salicanalis]MBJ7881822.1 response regulator [Gelidibacter salicanalis]
MKKKIKCVLLIDDDLPTNFLSERVLKKTDCTERIVAVQSGIEALEYLKSTDCEKHPRPDLFFLDINMPGMNGWEFLENYCQLEEVQKSEAIVVMLTTSLNPDERDKAKKIPQISSFLNKPLSTDGIRGILLQHFPDNFLTDTFPNE